MFDSRMITQLCSDIPRVYVGKALDIHQYKVHMKIEAKYTTFHAGIQCIHGVIQENIEKRTEIYN